MRISIIHSRYLSGPVSGENRVVEDEALLLRAGGHEVRVWTPSVEGVNGAALLRVGFRAIWSKQAARTVRRMIRRDRPDVLHCHNLFPALSPVVLRVASDEGVPLLLTLHNYRLMCLPGTFLRDGRDCEDCLGRLPWPGVLHGCYRGSALAGTPIASSLALHRLVGTFDRVALFLAVSETVRRKHVQAGLPADRIRVKPNFAWDVPKRSGPGTYFLYLGRLSPEKGVDTLLQAWRRAPSRLVVVGDGPDAERLRRSAPAGVEFRGSVPPSEILPLLNGARALLVPSLWPEGAPRVVIEAYAAGVPVLASNVLGLSELVEDEVSGLLLPPAQPDRWHEAATRLLDDAESDRLGLGARELWRRCYGPEQGLAQLEEAYRMAGAVVR
jgi:glycosyltransferase involved in cell wall biosynthesis